jgi:hypothetical protein
MEIPSIGGMMLTVMEWTRGGNQKRTSWRRLVTFEATQCSCGYRGAITKIKLFSRSSNFIQSGIKHSVPFYKSTGTLQVTHQTVTFVQGNNQRLLLFLESYETQNA